MIEEGWLAIKEPPESNREVSAYIEVLEYILNNEKISWSASQRIKELLK